MLLGVFDLEKILQNLYLRSQKSSKNYFYHSPWDPWWVINQRRKKVYKSCQSCHLFILMSILVHLNHLVLKIKGYTGCPTKNYTLFWRTVAPLNFELWIKVGGVLESSGSQLFKTVPTFDFWPSKSWDIWGWRHQGSLLDIIFLYYSYIKCSF